ncbi:MAG: hypothetical protein V1755_09875 [Chloroflexota bacterium]
MTLRDFFNSLFGRRSAKSHGTVASGASVAARGFPDSPNEPAQICNPRILLVILNPTMDTSTRRKLQADMDWARPDSLASRFIADVLQASGGLVRYQIAERIELDEFPVLADGFRYDANTYREVLRGTAAPHTPPGIDYLAILERFNVVRKVESRQLDEVWVMGYPHAGMYESVMAGAKAFWCNAPPLTQTAACKRRFVIMGFSFERDVGEMLHSYNHRAEAVLAHLFGSLDFLAWAYKPNRVPATIRPDQKLNLFERFILFDKIAPGKSGVGSVHYAPNGVKDYDLGSPRLVASECHDWLRFPDFQGDVRMISASEWGGGSERTYQRWWMGHLPKTAGRKNGIHNNWWQYVANLDNVAD